MFNFLYESRMPSTDFTVTDVKNFIGKLRLAFAMKFGCVEVYCNSSGMTLGNISQGNQ